jgi:hypothetical protein
MNKRPVRHHPAGRLADTRPRRRDPTWSTTPDGWKRPIRLRKPWVHLSVGIWTIEALPISEYRK